jgi:hypothetical protein
MTMSNDTPALLAFSARIDRELARALPTPELRAALRRTLRYTTGPAKRHAAVLREELRARGERE